MTDQTVVIVQREVSVVEVVAQAARPEVHVVANPETRVIEVSTPGPQGPRGERGERGEQGPAGDLTSAHHQTTPSDVWTIDHGMGKRPSVFIEDSAGDEVEGAVSYPTLDRCVVRFSAPFTGTAYLN